MTLFWAERDSSDAEGHLVVTKMTSPEVVKDFLSQIVSLAAQ